MFYLLKKLLYKDLVIFSFSDYKKKYYINIEPQLLKS